MKTCQPWPPKTSRVETRGSLRACQVSGGSMENGGKWRLGMSKRCFFEKGSRSSMLGLSCYEKFFNSFGIDFCWLGSLVGCVFFLFPLDHEIHVFKNSRHPTTQVAKDYFHPTRKSKSSNEHVETTKNKWCTHLKKGLKIVSKLGGGFKYFFIFTLTWGDDPTWLILFKGVENTT